MSMLEIRASGTGKPEAPPADWRRMRLCHLSAQPIRSSSSEGTKGGATPSNFRSGNADAATSCRRNTDAFADSPHERKGNGPLWEHDLLISGEDADFGRPYSGKAFQNGANPVGRFLRISPTPEIDPSFLSYWTQSRDYREQVDMHGFLNKFRPRGEDVFRNLVVPTPDIETQRRVARFLDGKTTRIDNLFRMMSELLDELAEWRETVVFHAVTGGVDSDVPLKSPGIEWADKIPDHWRTASLKWLLRSFTRGTHSKLQPLGEVAVLRANNLVGEAIDYTDLRFLSGARGIPILADGDVLLSCTSGQKLFGLARVFRVDHGFPVSYSSGLTGLRFGELMNSDYANYVIGTRAFGSFGHDWVMPDSVRGDAALIRFLAIKFPVPPIEEQSRIVSYLNGKIDKWKQANMYIEQSIAEVIEYRSSVITDAVTGKMGKLQ